MNVLVTSSRMPFALDEIRKFHELGHTVIAADTYSRASGLHSKAVARSIVLPSPSQETRSFVDAVAQVVYECGVDLIVPQFEEVFFLARHRDRLGAELFAPDFDTLLRVHDKATFLAMCQDMGLLVPETATVTTLEDLKDAAAGFGRYFARAAFSRGGVELLTNTGPLAGAVDIEDCEPSAENPWVVQRFVEGVDLCSFSVVRDGEVHVHCTYEHPRTLEHAGGIQFMSVDEPETLEIARRIAERTGYDGQLSFDYMKSDDGMYIIECNPRPTDGVAVMEAQEVIPAITEKAPPPLVVAPAGRERQLDLAMLRDMVVNRHDIPSDLKDLLDVPDVYAARHDWKPLLYTALSYGRVVSFRSKEGRHVSRRSLLAASQFVDISYDGQPIP